MASRATGDDRVELTDLDVISRYSLAVRTASVAREELVATLRADLAWLEQGGRPVSSAADDGAPARKTAAKRPAAKRTTTRG
jgi:hypothetical protein